jgi:predicted N-acetyltransferase YhbS
MPKLAATPAPTSASRPDVVYLTEDPTHDAAILLINEEAFGPGRFTRAAERVREQGTHERALSYVAADRGEVIASVRLTPVAVGDRKGHLLGPLAVRPSHKNLGIGRELVRLSVAAAMRRGSHFVLLVGDPPYYGPLGFTPVARDTVLFPGPVDPARILVAGHDKATGLLEGRVVWRGE